MLSETGWPRNWFGHLSLPLAQFLLFALHCVNVHLANRFCNRRRSHFDLFGSEKNQIFNFQMITKLEWMSHTCFMKINWTNLYLNLALIRVCDKTKWFIRMYLHRAQQITESSMLDVVNNTRRLRYEKRTEILFFVASQSLLIINYLLAICCSFILLILPSLPHTHAHSQPIHFIFSMVLWVFAQLDRAQRIYGN